MCFSAQETEVPKKPLKVVKQTLSIVGVGKRKFCSFSTVFPAVPAAVSQGDSKMSAKERVDGGLGR